MKTLCLFAFLRLAFVGLCLLVLESKRGADFIASLDD